MIKSGIMVKRIPDAQKGSYYTKIFPINTKPLSIDTVNQVRIFAKKIDGVKETNMLAPTNAGRRIMGIIIWIKQRIFLFRIIILMQIVF